MLLLLLQSEHEELEEVERVATAAADEDSERATAALRRTVRDVDAANLLRVAVILV